MYIYDTGYEKYNITLAFEKYRNNNTLAVEAYDEDGEPLTVITVNLPGGKADTTHQYVDTNNNPEIEKFLVDNNIAHPTGDIGISGFCTYPLYEFNITEA